MLVWGFLVAEARSQGKRQDLPGPTHLSGGLVESENGAKEPQTYYTHTHTPKCNKPTVHILLDFLGKQA